MRYLGVLFVMLIYTFGSFVSGSSNACEEATAGTVINLLDVLSGTNVDKTDVMAIWSCGLPSALGTEEVTLALLGLEPVEEFLL